MYVLLGGQRRPVRGVDAVCLPGEMFVDHDCSGPVGRRSVTVRRMRAFAVASEVCRGDVPVAVATAFAYSPVNLAAFS